jgi:Raf kinase inhibitor-like YbhB/YbcL family protein
MQNHTILMLAYFIACSAAAQQGDGVTVAISTVVNKPAKVEATTARINALRAPPGFSVRPFASGLKNVRIVAVAPNGAVYASRRDQGDVILLNDADGDGVANGPPIVVARRAGAHGLAIHGSQLYLATVKEVFVARIKPDNTLGELKMIIGDLPDSGQHPNRTLAWGPDNMLYLSVGSTCNTCNESSPESATLLRASPDGKSRTIFASGLRNTIGFAWHPTTGALWGMDHGIDFMGDDVQKEELNLLERGKTYGWPHVFGANEIYPQSTPPGDITKEQWKAQSTPMVLGYTAHAAPMQLVFNTGGNFPRAYDGDAFVTMRGSWNRMPASGYEIARIRFTDGKPTSIEPFVTGFLAADGKSHFGRPVGLAMAKDGAMLMADDANGIIYRIAHNAGAGAVPLAAPPPANAMEQQAAKGNNVPLAKDRNETATTGKMTVTSSGFAAGKLIPAKYSEYADGVSPPLTWSKVANAKSYVVIAEDPDAIPFRPFVHWLAWNIPPGLTGLPEGLQEQARLTEPDGVTQGKTTRGSIGYMGPRPPIGDRPHHYYFQVFALDTMLDLPFGADRDQLLDALKGHVIGKGVVMGSYAQTVKPAR